MQGTELKEKSQQLIDGPLKHIRGAALAAALLPLASIAATPASAQVMCQSSGTLCGVVFNDTNKNGIQDRGETGIEGVKVTLIDGSDRTTVETNPDGTFFFNANEGTYTIGVEIPDGYSPSPANVGSDDTIDSDGADDHNGFSVATVTLEGNDNPNTDFGLFKNAALNPAGNTRLLEEPSRGLACSNDDDVQFTGAGDAQRDDRQRRQLHQQHDRGC